MQKGNFEGLKLAANCKVQTLWHELCKKGCTNQDAIWDADSCGPKEACIKLVHIGATW